jgi:Ribonuclease G/E
MKPTEPECFMNKELFVSSTPHEAKVGLVEDDLLAEVYLERENEYTLAGSIYKGRVTRVLPGMQSAFVDIGLERDAFLYVSDFMELEEHDDDLTDVVPANRGVQDLRPQPSRQEAAGSVENAEPAGVGESLSPSDEGDESIEAEGQPAQQSAAGAETAEPANGNEAGRERGGWRGRRRRRGGRRERGSERSTERSDRNERGERAPEPRLARPAEPTPSRPVGPPAGYQPILLPGESISKYQRFAQQAPRSEMPSSEASDAASREPSLEQPAAVAATFPEDEPIFAASESISEPLHEQHEDTHTAADEPLHSAATSTNWNREFRQPEAETSAASSWTEEVQIPVGMTPTIAPDQNDRNEEREIERNRRDEQDASPAAEESVSLARESQAPVFAAPGTMEEETIDDEEADAVQYESSSDEGYDEFEEETQAADHLNGDTREAVTEIHMASMADSGDVPAAVGAAPAEGEEDSEELELEEAQAEAEALLDAEARGNGTVDARAEVRAPAATAGYTQRTQRPRFERPGYERRGGDRGRRGGGGGGGARRFRRRESAPVPLISDLLKEGQEILVQIAKEPIGKKGARITSHIALPGRFLVYMPTVNHTGVSRKISSEEERQRLKRIILSERENGHGGFIVRTAAQSASEEELRADIRFLKGLWQDIKNRAENSKPPALIYHDLNVVERVLRDQVTSDFSVIWVDTEAEYERILRFFNRFQPAMVKRVKLYTKETQLL